MIDYTQYLNQAIESTSALVRDWLGEAALRSDLEGEFQRTLTARMESQEKAAGYAELCPVKGGVPTDYHLREIRILDDLSVLAGIHFRNLSLDFPFVGIFAPSRFLNPDEFVPASRYLAEEFRLFQPRSVRWWSSSEGFDIRTLPDAVGDQRLIVGSISELLAIPSPTSTDYLIRLEPETEAAGYDRYAHAWKEFLEANPQWLNRLPMTNRAEFKECEEVEGLYSLIVNEEYAGVIAARPGELNGIRGWEMIEELLTTPFRGKGLAPLMQQLFIERLDRAKGSLLFGTIDDRNFASMKTALHTGRRDAGGWVFLSAS